MKRFLPSDLDEDGNFAADVFFRLHTHNWLIGTSLVTPHFSIGFIELDPEQRYQRSVKETTAFVVFNCFRTTLTLRVNDNPSKTIGRKSQFYVEANNELAIINTSKSTTASLVWWRFLLDFYKEVSNAFARKPPAKLTPNLIPGCSSQATQRPR